MLVLVLPLESLVSPWPRRVYGGSCKTCPFGMFQTVQIGGFTALACLVSCFSFSCGVALSMGGAAKCFECFQVGSHVLSRGSCVCKDIARLRMC